MIQGQYKAVQVHQPSVFTQQKYLLQHHPVLLPLLLFGSSVGLCMLSFFANTLFPVLALLHIPVALLCLSLALVLGIAGLLTTIISLLERIDRLHRTYLETTVYSGVERRGDPCGRPLALQLKEQKYYANRN